MLKRFDRCQWCRRRKIKCSGQSPCNFCTSKSLACVFDEKSRKVVVSEEYVYLNNIILTLPTSRFDSTEVFHSYLQRLQRSASGSRPHQEDSSPIHIHTRCGRSVEHDIGCANETVDVTTEVPVTTRTTLVAEAASNDISGSRVSSSATPSSLYGSSRAAVSASQQQIHRPTRNESDTLGMEHRSPDAIGDGYSKSSSVLYISWDNMVWLNTIPLQGG